MLGTISNPKVNGPRLSVNARQSQAARSGLRTRLGETDVARMVP